MVETGRIMALMLETGSLTSAELDRGSKDRVLCQSDKLIIPGVMIALDLSFLYTVSPSSLEIFDIMVL